LAAAAQLRSVLDEELGLDPSVEVRDLEAAILRQDPSLDGASGEPAGPSMDGREPSLTQSVDDTPLARDAVAEDAAGPIVGREDVLAILDEVLAQAGRGRGRAVLVEGSAGIGKSTILRALAGRIDAGGGQAVQGAGVPSEAGAPALWPWVGILRELVLKFPDLVDDPSTAALAQIDPGLTNGSPGHAADEHPQFSRTRLYRAVIDLLTLARRQSVLTVVIDDAQWLDEESSKLLTVAVPELTGHGVLFAFGFRSDESTAAHDALAMLGGIRRDDVVRLRLRGLDEAEVAGVIERISETAAEAAVTTAITRRTSGNPLFVTELVRLLVSEQRLDPVGVYAFLPDGTGTSCVGASTVCLRARSASWSPPPSSEVPSTSTSFSRSQAWMWTPCSMDVTARS